MASVRFASPDDLIGRNRGPRRIPPRAPPAGPRRREFPARTAPLYPFHAIMRLFNRLQL